MDYRCKIEKRTIILKGIDDIRKERAERLKELRSRKFKVSRASLLERFM